MLLVATSALNICIQLAVILLTVNILADKFELIEKQKKRGIFCGY